MITSQVPLKRNDNLTFSGIPAHLAAERFSGELKRNERPVAPDLRRLLQDDRCPVDLRHGASHCQRDAAIAETDRNLFNVTKLP